jgi:hypothetical protein
MTANTAAAIATAQRRSTEADCLVSAGSEGRLGLFLSEFWPRLLRIRCRSRLVSRRAQHSCGLRALATSLPLDLRHSLIKRFEMLVELRIHNARFAQLAHQRLPRALVDIVACSLGRSVEPVDRLAQQGIVVSHHQLARIQRIGGA